MEVTGHCFCGYVNYSATVDENFVLICHCTTCQRHSATAYGVSVAVTNDSFQLLSGEMKSHEAKADSGAIRSRKFCPECGTRIFGETIGEGMSFVGLRVGTIDQRDQLTPRIQIWCRSAQPWALIDSIPKFEMQPDFEELR